jgi:hypothetical protein
MMRSHFAGARELGLKLFVARQHVEPEWQDLQQRCVQWDEYLENDIDERGEDP